MAGPDLTAADIVAYPSLRTEIADLFIVPDKGMGFGFRVRFLGLAVHC
jgi:hypothetical protein